MCQSSSLSSRQGREAQLTNLIARLEAHEFRLPERAVTRSMEETLSAAGRIGYPVVLKAHVEGLLHKTEVGAVQLHLANADELRSAYVQMHSDETASRIGTPVEETIVEKECTDGIEVFLGIERNPQLGPTITFGIGGIFAEWIGDVQVRTVPLSEADATHMIRSLKGIRLLRGFRGLPPVSETMLVERILAASSLSEEIGDQIESIDLNPILVRGAEHMVLDAKAIWASAKQSLQRVPGGVRTEHLERFFEARSVAVVGASATPGKVGNAVLASLLAGAYKGEVYPVNPKRAEILGRTCYPELNEIPGPVDLVVAATPLSAVPAVIRDCSDAGVHNLVIVSGGGKETGDAGRVLEEEIGRLGDALGVRMIGPNCIGVFDGQTRVDTFFQPHDRMTRPPAGRLAVVTQSGTVGAAMIESAAATGISRFVSLGNRADVDEGDLIRFLGEEPNTDVIACYLEGSSNGGKMLDAIRKVCLSTPVVVYKAGRSPEGAAGAVSHTGFFGGTYRAWSGALAQAGAILVDSVEELFAVAKACVMQPQAAGTGIAMIGNGAGPMVQGLDQLAERGLTLPRLVEETVAGMRELYPPHFIVGNPLDVTGSATAHDYSVGIRALLDDPHVNVVMPWFVFQDAGLEESIVDRLAEIAHDASKPILCGASGGAFSGRMSAAIEAAGVPVFATVREWMAAAGGLAAAARRNSV